MYWSIKFNGYYPVGAIAVVRAERREGAEMAFKTLLREKMPGHDPGKLEIQPLKLGQLEGVILLDGNY